MFDMVVGVHRSLGGQLGSGQLAAAVGDYLVHVHVELGAAAGHPHMQRKVIPVLTRQDFVAGFLLSALSAGR